MISRVAFVAFVASVFLPVFVSGSIQDQVVVASDDLLEKKWGYTNCGTSGDAIQLDKIEVTPEEPRPGQDMTVFVSGIAQQDIETGAYADVTVKLGLVKLLQKRFDICEEAKNGNVSLSCPVEQGQHEVTKTVTLPKEIPPAKFVVQIRGYTNSDDDMACVDLWVDFRKPRRFW